VEVNGVDTTAAPAHPSTARPAIATRAISTIWTDWGESTRAGTGRKARSQKQLPMPRPLEWAGRPSPR
jgi:hypothetical protein